jgi:mRNA interferase YafQ
MLELKPTTQFRKDFKKLSQSDISDLSDVLKLLQMESPLPEKYKKHDLKGNRQGVIDIHIKSDLVLLYEIYTIEESEELIKVLSLIRIGNHAILFKN